MSLRKYVSVVVAVLAACGTATSCSSSSKSAAPTSTTTVGTAPATSSPTTSTATPACHPAAGYEPGTGVHHLGIAGVQREFLVHVPPHPKAAMKLVVDFHGAGSDMRQQAIYSGFDAVADRDGFVVATPNGIDAAIRQWRFLGTPDDVNFAKAIVRTLARNACVDASHAYATGISSGGAMTASLACQASDAFAGFAPVAADFYLPQICDKAQRRPIVIFHGTADAIVPYAGGRIATGSGLGVGAAETTAAAWARHNGCTAGPLRNQPSTEVIRIHWNGCATPVVMYRIEGGGHTWPGAAIDVARLGATAKQISATSQMMKFFAAND